MGKVKLPVAGGEKLNFRVVRESVNPAENTICIHTDADISGYVFSAEAPAEPAEGTVWIQTGSKSSAAFSATRKNPVMVYPIGAKQYIDGVWEAKAGSIWQNGALVKFSDTRRYLYNSGDLCEAVTGGWGVNITAPTITYGEDTMTIRASAAVGNTGGARFANKIDITGADRLCIAVEEANAYKCLALVVATNYELSAVLASCEFDGIGVSGEYSIDLSGVPAGTYYIGFTCGRGSTEVSGVDSIEFEQMWLE